MKLKFALSQHHLQGYREEIARCHERMLDPEFEEKSWVKLTIRETFKASSKVEQSVVHGYCGKNHSRDWSACVIRDGVVILMVNWQV